MKVLVTAASRHGATTEIAHRIAEVLSTAGIEAHILEPSAVIDVSGYDAVVLGSAVYAGRWLGPAKELVEREAEALASRPVWLFSSGPIGEPPKPDADPVDVEAIRGRIHPVDHRRFAGRLERKGLGLAERAILAVVRAPEGDFRSWPDVTEWASGIAGRLHAGRVGEAGR